jgi:16S rRNA C1402 N4-methylase RsmH
MQVTRKAVVASDQEIVANPRSRSAKLRAVERMDA